MDKDNDLLEPDIGDCNLECKRKGFRLQNLKELSVDSKLPKFLTKGGKQTHEFMGPVKIVLVNTTKAQYVRRTWGSAVIVFAYFAMGATVMPIYFFSVSATPLDKLAALHVILFTTGLLSPTALLSMNVHNGSTSIVKPRHKKIDYLLIKAVSLACIVAGILCSMKSSTTNFNYKKISPHGFLGAAAVVLTVLDVCGFPGIPCNTKRLWPKLSLVLCIPSVLASSLCFILGLQTPNFLNWVSSQLMHFHIIVFCLYYTLAAVWNPFKTYMNHVSK